MKNRIKYLDVAKAIGILAIILGHISPKGIFQIIIHTFHVPIFFIITGFFINENESFKDFIKKKIKRCLIPYIGCSIILTTCISLINKFNFRQIARCIFKFITQIRFTTLWFLTALFLSSIIFYIIIKISKNNFKYIIINTIILSTTFILIDTYVKKALIWNIDTACIATIFMLFGYSLKKYKILEKIEKLNNCKKILISIALLIVGASFSIINYDICNKAFAIFLSSYGVFPLTIIAAMAISLLVIIFSMFLEKIKILTWLGQNTMAFFAFHQYMALPIMYKLFRTNIFIQISKSMNKFLCNSLYFIGIMLICLLMHIILTKSHLAFILGKSNKINEAVK